MTKELIEMIYQILAERQTAVLKNVLVIVFGCNHNEELIAHLLKKYQKNCQYTFIFSSNSQINNETSLFEELGEKKNAFQLLEEGTLKDFDTVLVPFMTRNSLAKTVCGISDTNELTVLQHAFLMRKVVIISNHGFRLDTDYAVYKELDKNQYMYQKIQEQENILKKMGAKVGNLQNFKLLVEENFGSIFGSIIEESIEEDNVLDDKKVITQRDVLKNPNMIIPTNVILTDLAKEQIKKNNT